LRSLLFTGRRSQLFKMPFTIKKYIDIPYGVMVSYVHGFYILYVRTDFANCGCQLAKRSWHVYIFAAQGPRDLEAGGFHCLSF